MKQHAFDREETKVKTFLNIIVTEEDKSSSYTYDEVSALIKKGHAIVLSNTKTLESQISFYKANQKNHTLEQRIKFGKFFYVKEFIDELIAYKMSKKEKNISDEEIKDIEVNFIASRVEQIVKNYKSLEEEQARNLKRKLAEEKEKREARLKKMLAKKSK